MQIYISDVAPWPTRHRYRRIGASQQVRHGRLTAEALESTNAEHGAEERIDAWFGHKGHAHERYRQMLDDIRAVGRFDLATLSVALREVRNLAEAGNSPASTRRSGT